MTEDTTTTTPDGRSFERQVERCHANRDGDCVHVNCPQLRDNEPHATGRHCPLDVAATAMDDEADDRWLDDEGDWCDRCNGDGRDPMTDYLLPCPACQGEQH